MSVQFLSSCIGDHHAWQQCVQNYWYVLRWQCSARLYTKYGSIMNMIETLWFYPRDNADVVWQACTDFLKAGKEAVLPWPDQGSEERAYEFVRLVGKYDTWDVSVWEELYRFETDESTGDFTGALDVYDMVNDAGKRMVIADWLATYLMQPVGV